MQSPVVVSAMKEKGRGGRECNKDLTPNGSGWSVRRAGVLEDTALRDSLEASVR